MSGVLEAPRGVACGDVHVGVAYVAELCIGATGQAECADYDQYTQQRRRCVPGERNRSRTRALGNDAVACQKKMLRRFLRPRSS